MRSPKNSVLTLPRPQVAHIQRQNALNDPKIIENARFGNAFSDPTLTEN